jgi:hypothetical protein
MRKNGTYYIQLYSLVVFGFIIVGYGLFQAEKILSGPSIQITSPLNGATYTTRLIEIKGKAKNIKTLLLNDRPLYTDMQGNFSEKLLLSPGYTILKVYAEDKFGTHTEKRIEVILRE